MKRIGYLDILRIAAAFAIVVFHVLGSAVHNAPAIPAGLADNAARIKSMLVWPVPLFWMISGFLWLHPEKKCTFSTVLPNIRRFTLVLISVGYVYALMEHVFTARTISAQFFLLSFADVLTGRLWDHMWYLYAAIGVYLSLPILKPFFDTSSVRSKAVLCILLWGFTILVPLAEDGFGYVFPVDFPLTAPLFYVCSGGLLNETSISRRIGISAFVLFLASCAMCAFGSNTALLTSVSAPALFIAAKGLLNKQPPSIRLAALARCTFGIYLFQQFFINLLIKALHIYPLQYPAVPCIAVTSLLVFLLSFALTAWLRHIPMIRKYLL